MERAGFCQRPWLPLKRAWSYLSYPCVLGVFLQLPVGMHSPAQGRRLLALGQVFVVVVTFITFNSAQAGLH